MKEIGEKYTCIACMLSKRKSQSVAFNLKNPDGFRGELSSKIATPGQIISLDPVGPIVGACGVRHLSHRAPGVGAPVSLWSLKATE